MAVLPVPNVTYTELDFDSLRARAFNLISSVFPDWTEQDVANFGNILVELGCFVGDTLGFYLDNRSRESRLVTATQRASVIGLVKLLNYSPAGATAATTEETFSLAAAAANDVVFPAGTVVKTSAASDPLVFQTLTELTIPSGQTSGVVDVENSQSWTDTFPTTGLATQTVTLGNTPHLDNSTTVTASNGSYTKVSNFLQSGVSDRHFTLVVDSNSRATLRFGDGINGQIPSGTITVDYKTGGGSEGNVEPNSIRRLDGSFTDELGFPVTVSVTNLSRASGGTPRESIKQIQQNAPAAQRALTRTVSREDYEINGKRVPGTARLLMLTNDELSSIPENRGRLYVIPTGGGLPSGSLKTNVLTMVTVTYPNSITFKVDVLDPAYLTVDVQAVVHPTKGTNKVALAALIRANLVAFFALTTGTGEDLQDNPNVNFGFYASQDSTGAFDGSIAWSDLYNAVRDTVGVRKIHEGPNSFLLNGANADADIAIHQFPQLGTVTLIDAETGTALGS